MKDHNDDCDCVACDGECDCCKELCAYGISAGGISRRETKWAPTGDPFADGFARLGDAGPFEVTAVWDRNRLDRASGRGRLALEINGTFPTWAGEGRRADNAEPTAENIDRMLAALDALDEQAAPSWNAGFPDWSLDARVGFSEIHRFACPEPRCPLFIAVHRERRNVAFLFDYGTGNPSIHFCVPFGGSWRVDGYRWLASETRFALAVMERVDGGAALRDAMLDRFASMNPDAALAAEPFRRAKASLEEALAKAEPPAEPSTAMQMGFASATAAEFWLAWVDASRVDAAKTGAFVVALPEIVEHQYPKSALRDFIGRLAAAGRADAIREICKAAPYDIGRKVIACIGLHKPAEPHSSLAAAMEGVLEKYKGEEADTVAANYAAAFAEGYPNAAAGYAALRDADPALFRRVASTEDGFRTMLRLVVAAVAGGGEGGPEGIASRCGARRLATALRGCVVDSPQNPKLLKAHRDDFARMVAEMDEEWLHHPVETAALELLWTVLVDAGARFPRPPQYYASVAGWRKDTLEQVEKLALN